MTSVDLTFTLLCSHLTLYVLADFPPATVSLVAHASVKKRPIQTEGYGLVESRPFTTEGGSLHLSGISAHHKSEEVFRDFAAPAGTCGDCSWGYWGAGHVSAWVPVSRDVHSFSAKTENPHT